MNRASLDLATVLADREHQENLALSDLALLGLESRAVGDLVRGNLLQRRLDMEASIGIWAEREDLADTEAFLRNLRKDDRSERFLEL